MKKIFDIECADPERLIESFKDLGPSEAITTGHYEVNSECDARDLDWNHMDQHHRTYVHNLYGATIRLVRAQNFALTLTQIPFLGFPLMVLISDVRLRPGLFYQAFNLLNLVHVHVVIRSLERIVSGQKRGFRTVDWYIVSHQFFKFLHGWINRKLSKINHIQNPEDFPLQEKRAALRSKGYRFDTDDPNFINSNVLKSNIIYPKLDRSYSLAIDAAKSKKGKHRVSAGPVDFLIELTGESELSVWLADCPHEGAPMEAGVICGDQIQCAWHGLRFGCVKLSPHHKNDYLNCFNLTLENDQLIVSQN